MTFRKKVTLSALAFSMLTASLGGFPLSQKGLAEKLGFSESVYAAETELPSSIFLERMNGLHAALAAGDPTDRQEVRNLRDEIAGLDAATNQQLIDPIWKKISAKLPETADQAELKASLFQLLKDVGSFRYDPTASDLEAIRTNPEYRATLKTIAAAGGDENIKLDDFLVFMFGDGGSRKGVEGTIGSLLAAKSPTELVLLLSNKQGLMTVMLQATEQLLGETGSYKFSSILKNLGVTSQDVQSTVLSFQAKLKHDEPAMSAMTVAYIRSAAKSSVKINDDGRVHTYSLNVYGAYILPAVLQWSKLSGDDNVTVLKTGVVTIPDEASSGTAIIQAKLVNPYGGAAKVIFEQEVTLKAAGTQETEFPAAPFLERLNKLHGALAAGDPADLAAVRNLRDEIGELNFTRDQALIDPIWTKLSAGLPASADKDKLKASLFNLIKEVSGIPYESGASSLEAIRANAEYRAAMKALGAAGGEAGFVVDDLLLFMFGDGSTRPGVEGTIRQQLAGMSSTELLRLLGDKQATAAMLLQTIEQLLAETGTYKVSSLLGVLGVSSKEVSATVVNFQMKLKKDEPAIQALTTAIMRAEASETVKVSENGREQSYTLKVFGVDVPALALRWSKVSGSEAVKVAENGSVTLARGVATGSAVIQAAFINPYGGAAKVIFAQEVTLTAVNGEGDQFPAEQFLERMNKLHASLLAGDPQDVKDVRSLRDELAKLDFAKDQALINPIWNKIEAKLPSSVNKVELKKSLFQLIKAVSTIQYDPQGKELEAIRTNAEYRATLKTIAAAGGVASLTMDDFLVLMFGDGEDRPGIEGSIRNIISDMKSKDIAQLLGNKDKINAVLTEAMAKVLSSKQDYALSEAFSNLGVKSTDVRAVVVNFQNKLKYDEKATNALTVAYVRSEVISTTKVTSSGRQHEYTLKLFGTELPSSYLRWKKVSGSKDVTVAYNGKVTIPKKVESGTAVIQATIINPYGGSAKVVFQQEITLTNGDFEVDPKEALKKIADSLDAKLADIKKKLKAAKDDEQKAQLIVEVVQARSEAVNLINKVNATSALKNKAINETKSKVNKLLTTIISEIMRS
ncbi:hypothetical protein BK133_28695 [Paenibacillus sp. FSL H8-0548]|uniref:hypothetical protein n=1 Tax=Paenibacillus sp. FSL H8-0548 TaxID=1920422 RepID=UPI00096F0D72|nr:hypothetical protein [Paenibacillus sp. FSL H8-0548]OMF21251.1 hypothetical protein BK133_28695 [Paenibacillus sp. FSL H8-0548]